MLKVTPETLSSTYLKAWLVNEVSNVNFWTSKLKAGVTIYYYAWFSNESVQSWSSRIALSCLVCSVKFEV